MCNYSPGPVTPGASTLPKNASSTISELPGTQPQMNLDPVEDSDIQSRLACIAQENHAIKPQLSQLIGASLASASLGCTGSTTAS